MPLTDPYDSGSCDPAEWSANCHCHLPVDNMEPLTDPVTDYRDSALGCLRILLAVDRFMESSRDPRLAWCAVVFVLKLNSLPVGMSGSELAKAIGVQPAAVSRSVSRFREMAGLDSPEEIRAFGLPRDSNTNKFIVV